MKLPYGYTQMAGGEIVINDHHANVVRFIYQQYILGSSLGKIVDNLFEKQIPSPSGNHKWTRAAIDNTLKNGKYVPCVIPLHEFTEVQFQMATRSNLNENNNMRKTTRYNSLNVLSGLLICAECGANYRRITKSSSKIAWRCASKVEHGKAICRYAPTLSEETVKTTLCKVLNMPKFDEQLVKSNINAILIQQDGSFELKYKVESTQMVEY